MHAPDVGVLNVPPPAVIHISVLIVNFRAYAELTACLESLERFLANDVEVIVVDHLGEPAKAECIRRRFPWSRFIDVSANPGFAAGVNRAAKAAVGRQLLLLNPDCLVDEDVPHALSHWLDEHPRVAVCGALVREPDGAVQASARRFPDITTAFAGRTSWLTDVWPTNRLSRRNLVGWRSAGEPIEVDWVSGACMMVRRDAFEAVGGMDERFFLYWEDADLCFRLKAEGWQTAYNPTVGVTHLTGRSRAAARSRSLIAFHRGAYLYFSKHGGHVARATAPIVFVALHARLMVKLASLASGRAKAR